MEIRQQSLVTFVMVVVGKTVQIAIMAEMVEILDNVLIAMEQESVDNL